MKEKIKYRFFILLLLVLAFVITFFLHNYFESYIDSFMVVITFFYVVATYEICRTNIESTKATKEQLDEIKWQYEDKKRMEIMPYLQFEKAKDKFDYELQFSLGYDEDPLKEVWFLLHFKNIGNGTAKDISYEYTVENDDKLYKPDIFPVQSLFPKEVQTIGLSFLYDNRIIANRTACLKLNYKDLLNHSYSQELQLWFECKPNGELKLKDFCISSPVFVNDEKTVM